jgi:uncharacterized delta-60 repeat protein
MPTKTDGPMMKPMKRVWLALTLAFGGAVSVAQPGSLDLSFDPGSGADGNILTTAVQSDGKIIIGGFFTSYNGIVRNRIARLNADGSLDTSFDPGAGASDYVTSTAVQSDSKIIIAGSFTVCNGTVRNRIARLNTDGSLDSSFDPGAGASYTIEYTAVQSDGKIIIAGGFTSYSGTVRNRIARLNTDGSLDISFDPGTGANDFVRSIALQSDGKIIIGGYFSSYNGTVRTRIARLNTDGSLDTSFDPGTGAHDFIRSIALQSDGKIIIGGYFTSYNGTGRTRIARLNTDGSLDAGFDPGTGATGASNPIDHVGSIALQSDGKIIIGGEFTGYNGTVRNRIARLNTDGSLDTGFDPGTGANIGINSTTLQSDGKIIIGGIFTSYNGTVRNRIARLNADGSLDTGFDPGIGANIIVSSTALRSDGKVIIGGYFTSYNGTGRNRVARVLGGECAQQTYYADADGDTFGDPSVSQSACTQPTGFVMNNADCDDTNALVLGPTAWYADNDGDGWGVPPMLLACTQPVGYVNNDTDCDDTDPLLAPTPWCVDVDSDGHGDPNNTIWACDQPPGTVPVGGLCDDCNDEDVSIYPGAPCNDGNPATSDDVYLSDCSCLGTPCTNILFEVSTDAQGGDLEWEVYDAIDATVCLGSSYTANSSCLSESCCLPTGSYSTEIRLQNGASNFAGSYIIREAGNGRIVHNPDGFPGSVVRHGTNGQFAMEMGTDRLVEAQCDGQNLTSGSYLVAASNPLVAAQVVPGSWNDQSPNTGYVFWIFNPDGGYDRVFFESLRSTNPITGGQNNRARHLDLDGAQVLQHPPPSGVLLNVRIAHRINGTTSAFGPACRFILNAPTTPNWPNHLVDLPGDALHSCGTTKSFSTSNTNNRVYAVSIASGANYRFEWTRISGGAPAVVTITRASGNNTNNRFMALSNLPAPSWMANWTNPTQPQPGDVWSVRVAHQRFGQSQWSAFGPCCTVTFDAGGSAMVEQPNDAFNAFAEMAMELWPNPNKDHQLNLALRGMETNAEVLRITMLDVQGRLAYERILANPGPGAVTTLDLAGMAPGLYLVRATVGEQHFTERLVVE